MIDGRNGILQALLDDIAQRFDVASAAVVLPDARSAALRISASVGLDTAASEGLTAAIARPGHPIARTFAEPTATWNVTPINPGGPALRSHLPLVVRHDAVDRVVGVLALAHDRAIEPDVRPDIEAIGRLAATAIDQDGAG